MIVYVHGGGWIFGNRAEVSGAGELTAMLSLGWSVVSIDYRLTGNSSRQWPTQIRDVRRGLNLDPSTVVVTGFSAGGQLALLAGTSCKIARSRTVCPQSLEPVLSASSFDRPLRARNSRPDAVVSLSGVVDMAGQARRIDNLGFVIAALMGCATVGQICDQAKVDSSDPTTFLDRSDPPVYFAYSPGDPIVDPVMHATAILPKWESVLGSSRLWVDVEESLATGRWLDLDPAGDGVREYYTRSGHDTYFLNASAVRNFLEKIRLRVLT